MAHAGLIKSRVPGRTDRLPMSVAGGSYIIPADVVSGIGEGNSDAGAALLDRMFARANVDASQAPAAGPAFADGGSVSGLPEGFVLDKGGPPEGFIIDEQPELAWSDVPVKALQNAPQSAVEFGKNLVQPIIHPIDTAKGLASISGGIAEKAAPYVGSAGPIGALTQGIAAGSKYLGGNESAADAFGQFFKDRYGSVGALKHTLATDPIGAAADLSTVLTGGGSAASRLPGLAGRVGEVVNTAGRVVDPLSPLTIGARRLVSPREVTPERAAARDALRQEGVEVTAGQLTGSDSLKHKEATSGEAGQRVNERQQRQLTTAALRHIGETGDNVHDAIERARPRIGQEIEDAAANLRVRADPELMESLTTRLDRQMRDEGYSVNDPEWRRARAMADSVIGAFDFVPRSKRVKPGPDHMEMSGEAFHSRIKYNSAIQRAIREGGDVGHYATQIREALYDAAERTANRSGTRDYTGDRLAYSQLQEARRQWKNLLALEHVIAGAPEAAAAGRLTPALMRQLATFHEKTDYSRGRSDFAGLARNSGMLMQELPKTGAYARVSQAMPHIVGGALGTALGWPGGPGGAGFGAALGATLYPRLQGAAVMSPLGQRYLSSGRLNPFLRTEAGLRALRAAGAATRRPGYDDGGAANPYASDAINNALDTGADIAGRALAQQRMDDAYDTSVDRWKQLFLSGADIPKAPPWELAAGLIGGIKAPRWTPAQDAALAKYIKGDALVVPAELEGRTQAALQQRALEKGLREPAQRYKRQPGDAAPKPAADYLDLSGLAAEPRAAVLFMQRAADSGDRIARANMNQLASVAPSKRDALLQSWIDRFRAAGWKPGMKRGGPVRRNPFAKVA